MSLKNFQKKIGAISDGIIGKNTITLSQSYLNKNDYEISHFFGQTSHETSNFRIFVENLNYSSNGLKTYFGKYFKGNEIYKYQRKPEMIANRVYANRMGNGDENSGDGWKFRGRGALQLTGRYNYILFSKYINDYRIITNPDLVATEYAFESALFYFNNNNIWNICDTSIDVKTIKLVTKKINGGYNGLNDRIHLTNKFYNYIK